MTEPLPTINPSLLGCSWEDFKKMAVEFHNDISTLDLNELDQRFKNITDAYFNLKCEPVWKKAAIIVLDMATQDFMSRELELVSTK